VNSPGLLVDFHVRFAQPSDQAALAGLHEALWPESSADEHSSELASILAGKAPGALPLVILVAEASDGSLAGFLELGLRSHAEGCHPSRAVGYVEGWYVAGEHIVSVGLAKGSWPPRKTGHGATAARRWLRTP
jgi:hypothetical protein